MGFGVGVGVGLMIVVVFEMLKINVLLQSKILVVGAITTLLLPLTPIV